MARATEPTDSSRAGCSRSRAFIRGTSQLAWHKSVAPCAAAVRNCFSRGVNFLPSLISKALDIFCVR